jgi:phosphate uptake regulator
MASSEQRVRHFQEELEQLKARLLEMGGLAEEQVRLAVKGLVDRDRDLVARVLTTRTAVAPTRGRCAVTPLASSADGRRPARHRRGGEDRTPISELVGDLAIDSEAARLYVCTCRSRSSSTSCAGDHRPARCAIPRRVRPPRYRRPARPQRRRA